MEDSDSDGGSDDSLATDLAEFRGGQQGRGEVGSEAEDESDDDESEEEEEAEQATKKPSGGWWPRAAATARKLSRK